MRSLPTAIGRFEVLSEIGRGAMGIVYQARDPILDRVVAIKVLRTDYAVLPSQETEFRARFLREAQAVARLVNKSIVAIYEAGETEDRPYFVMEFVQGTPLDQLLKTEGALAVGKALDIGIQVCDALTYAHKQGIVHRDIKPGNIMLTDDDVAKVTDFGIARLTSSTMTQTGRALGTPSYMSPEQISGSHVDGRSDIFSLGAVLYELLTGEKAFPGESVTTVLYRILHEDPVPPTRLNYQLPRFVDEIIRQALAKSASERYQDPGQLGEALKRCLTTWAPLGETVSIEAVRPPAAAPASPSSAHRESAANLRGPLALVTRGRKAWEKAVSWWPALSPRRRRFSLMALGGVVLAVVGISALTHSLRGSVSENPTPTGAPPAATTVVETAAVNPPVLPPRPLPAVPTPVRPTVVTKPTVQKSVEKKSSGPAVPDQESPAQDPPKEPSVGSSVESRAPDSPAETKPPEERSAPPIPPVPTPELVHPKPPPPPRPGSLRVETNPPSEVFLNGRRLGMAPQSLAEVPPGPHTVRLVLPDHPPRDLPVVVDEGKPAHVTFKFPPLGSLSVNATPWGHVEIDGTPSETTPVTKKLEAGTHRVTIYRDGYTRVERTVTVRPGEEADFSVTLRRQTQ